MSERIVADYKGEILEIVFNRPDKGNAMSDEMIVELGDILEREQRKARLIVLRGAGEEFCAGRAPEGARRAPPIDAFETREFSDHVFRCYGLLRASHAPVLAVVQGKALGFGFALAAAADVTIAADTARFQIPEFEHNIMPTMVMSSMIDRVPLKALMYHVWSYDMISPEKALAMGAVSDVVPRADLETAVERFTACILQAPRPAVHAVKEYGVNASPIDMGKAAHYARSLHAMVNSASAMKRT